MLRTTCFTLAAALLVAVAAPAQDDDWYQDARRDINAADRKNDHAAIIRLAGAALPKADRQFGAKSAEAYWVAYMLGRSYQLAAQGAKAKPHLDRVIAAGWSAGEGGRLSAWACYMRGQIARDDGQYDEATRLFADARRRADDAGVLDEFRSSLFFERGTTLKAQGKFADAVAVYKEAVEDARNRTGEDSKETAKCLRQYAHLLRELGKTDLADEVDETVREISRDHDDQVNARKAEQLFHDAEARIRAGDPAAAVRLYLSGIDLASGGLICQHMRCETLADLLHDAGHHDQGLVAAQAGLVYAIRAHGAEYPGTMEARFVLARSLRKVGRYEEARREVTRARDFFEASDNFNLCKL
jgi:tetratricopeptide (TPR) repeat protein